MRFQFCKFRVCIGERFIHFMKAPPLISYASLNNYYFSF
jgi:hypothetical protein